MSEVTTEHEYEVQLIDDGTLDTVVSVEGTEYRYTWYPDDEETTYEDFVAWAMKDEITRVHPVLGQLIPCDRDEIGREAGAQASTVGG